MIVIAQQLGCNRRRFDRCGKVDELPARRMMPPRRGSVATFSAYLRPRWNAGYCNGRMLFDEIRALGYVGTYIPLHKLPSPWRLGNVAFENTGANCRSAQRLLLRRCQTRRSRQCRYSSRSPLPVKLPRTSPPPSWRNHGRSSRRAKRRSSMR
jgi:hypothetical protein